MSQEKNSSFLMVILIRNPGKNSSIQDCFNTIVCLSTKHYIYIIIQVFPLIEDGIDWTQLIEVNPYKEMYFWIWFLVSKPFSKL